MKVFSVTGYAGSGKTTVLEKLIEELSARGFSVGTVKNIHFEDFRIDAEGKNTWRHRQAGAKTVTALSGNETDIMFAGKMPIYQVLSHYAEEFVALEGVRDAVVPNIACAQEDEFPQICALTIAVSGRFANSHNGLHDGLPVINALTDYKRLADLIIEKTPDLMFDIAPECCKKCGYDCRTFLSKCLKDEEDINNCVIKNRRLSLKIGGKDIVIVPFVENILRNEILGIVKELDGYKKGGKIEIEFTEASNKVFKSKKNRVYLSDDGTVVKECKKTEACDTEEEMLKKIGGNRAPKLISRKGNTLFIEHIEGCELVDEFINAAPPKAQKLAKDLAETVKSLYAVTGKITIDENFSNYIVGDRAVYRIDFEETASGTLRSWCAKLLAFASLYEAADASKLAFMDVLTDKLEVDGEALRAEYKDELEFLARRWKVPFPAEVFDAYINRRK